MSGNDRLTLADVSLRLGVHYMTVYRYVRTGRLAAVREGTRWVVLESDLRRFDDERHAIAIAPRDGSASDSVVRLVERLLDGDENGAWAIAQESLAGGASPIHVYQELFAPAMRTIGDHWATGDVTIADEHCASVVMTRLIGRGGPLFRSRGTRIGTVVVGAPSGEMHGLATSFAADILRAKRYDVVDLGADVPTDAFVQFVLGTNRLVAIAISVITMQSRPSARQLIVALRRSEVRAPIFLGGSGVDATSARDLGADHWADDISVVGAQRQARLSGRTATSYSARTSD